MLWVAAYDIPDNRRRTKLHRLMQAYGLPVQRSVFECYLESAERADLTRKAKALLDPREDDLRLYAVCETCRRAAETIGSMWPERPLLYLA